jgi:hypothetical protein
MQVKWDELTMLNKSLHQKNKGMPSAAVIGYFLSYLCVV